jgi:hypothetical protein
MRIKLQGAKVKACKENLQESMGCQGIHKQLEKLEILPSPKWRFCHLQSGDSAISKVL